MSTLHQTISCPVCGAPMNHHAEKLVYGSDVGDGNSELLEQFYRCPHCGAGESRILLTLLGI